MMEYFDICDEKGIPSGETIERSEAHAHGVLHRTAHIWVTRSVNGKRQVLLQQRSFQKDSYPGLFDTSSAGHIQAGDEPLESALRELQEELGIEAKEEQLHFAGTFRIRYSEEFYGRPFHDNEIVFVYVYQEPVNIDELQIQKEELECVRWFDLEEVYEACLKNREDICVPAGGLKVLMNYLSIQIPKKMIASDFDGSIRWSHDVTEEDREAIRRWREAGNLFVIDTGRSMESISEQAEKYDIVPDYYITNNGGMIYTGSGKNLLASYIDPVMAVDIMYAAENIGNVVSYVVNDGYHRHRIIVDETLKDQRYPSLEPDLSPDELKNLGRYAQIVISMDTVEHASETVKKINGYFPDVLAAYANRYVADIIPKGISKASGLRHLCEYLSFDEADVITFGDADNDIPLFHFNKNTYCISSAEEEVQKEACHTVSCIRELIDQNL